MAPEPIFDANSLVPLYVQAADYVAAQIASGELAKGSKLPAERDLAEQWHCLSDRPARDEGTARARVGGERVGKGTFVISGSE